MSAPGPPARPPRPRAGLAVQLGQTLIVLGLAVLAVGLFLRDAGQSAWVGAVLLLAGVVVFVVGLGRRRRRPPG